MSTATVGLHAILAACGPLGAVPDGVCNVAGGVASWTQDLAEAVQNPFRWLYHHSLGSPVPQQPGDPGWAACQADWSQTACPKLIDQLKPSHIPLVSTWPRVYSAFAVSGMFVAATACVVRVVRAMFDERVPGMHLVVDSIVRLLVAAGLLLSPRPDDSFLLGAMTWAAGASGHVATAAATAIASALGMTGDLGSAVGVVAAMGFGHAGVGNFLVAIPLLLVAIGFVYVVALYLLRVIQLVFAVATAPLFIAVAVFEPRNRFVQWWLQLLTSALVLPLVLAVFGALTAGIAMELLAGRTTAGTVGGEVEWVTRVLLACFAILGGIWMTGKAVHGIAWSGFSHGGITGAVTAVSTSVMALPSLVGNVGSAVRAAGGAGRGAAASGAGGVLPQGGFPVPAMSGAEAMVAAAALGHLGALPDARAADQPAADFAAHPAAAALLRAPASRLAFNRLVTAVVADQVRGGSSGAAEGPVAVEDRRLTEYTHALARHPTTGAAISGAAVASLLHNQHPDLSAILAAHAGPPQ